MLGKLKDRQQNLKMLFAPSPKKPNTKQRKQLQSGINFCILGGLGGILASLALLISMNPGTIALMLALAGLAFVLCTIAAMTGGVSYIHFGLNGTWTTLPLVLIGLLIPAVNLAILIIYGIRATTSLRNVGYNVTLWAGAKKPEPKLPV